MTDYRKMYKTSSKEAIARIKLLEAQNACLAGNKQPDAKISRLEIENKELAKEASALAIKNVELEKNNARLKETVRAMENGASHLRHYNNGAIKSLNDVIVRLFEERG